MKYIAFYDLKEFAFEKRAVAPSAQEVVEYMASVLSEIEPVEIISPSRTLLDRGFFRGRKKRVNDQCDLIQPPSIGCRSIWGKRMIALLTRLWLFFFLLFHLHRHETIVVYHSVAYMKLVQTLKFIFQLHVILEIREIYGDVLNNQKKSFREKKYFQCADGYVFATSQLNQLINYTNKPYVVCSGSYEVNTRIAGKRNDGKIHIVYAGNLSKAKGGAYKCLELAHFLSDKYQIHVIGYGTLKEIEDFKRSLNELNTNEKFASVSYDGLLTGVEYFIFLQSCHIGLSSQNTAGEFNNTSFPSKILSYLRNGLIVLSSDTEVVSESPVGRWVYYYEGNDARNIAEQIEKITQNINSQPENILEYLDHNLRMEMKNLWLNVVVK